MKLFSLLLQVLLIQMAWGQFTTLPKGFGFVENKASKRKQCVQYQVELECDEDHQFAQFLSTQCVAEPEHQRVKREPISLCVIAVFVAAAVVIALAGVVLATVALVQVKNEREINKDQDEQLKLHRKALRVLKSNSELEYRELQGLVKHLDKQSMASVMHLIFDEAKLESVLRFFKQDPRNLTRLMGYDDRIGLDVLRNMEYTFTCGETAKYYAITACDSSSPTRQFGEVKMVAPVGDFINGGTAFRYYNTPQFSVFNGTTPIPTGNCEKFGSSWSCGLPTQSCSVASYKNCQLITEYTPNGVFSIEMEDATYIATTHTHYALYENGSSTVSKYGDVPRSGHMLFSAPHDTVLLIGGKKFFGRHDTLFLEPISVWEKFEGLTHAEADAIENGFKEIGIQLDAADRLKVRRSISSGWFDGLSFFWSELGTICQIVVGVVSLACIGFVVILLIWVVWKLINCCSCKYRYVPERSNPAFRA